MTSLQEFSNITTLLHPWMLQIKKKVIFTFAHWLVSCVLTYRHSQYPFFLTVAATWRTRTRGSERETERMGSRVSIYWECVQQYRGDWTHDPGYWWGNSRDYPPHCRWENWEWVVCACCRANSEKMAECWMVLLMFSPALRLNTGWIQLVSCIFQILPLISLAMRWLIISLLTKRLRKSTISQTISQVLSTERV